MCSTTAGGFASSSSVDHLSRLLDGLEGREPSGSSSDETLGAAIAALVLSASDAVQLEEGLSELRRKGRTGDVTSVLRTLVEWLPSCRMPRAFPRETKALRAIGGLVALSRDPRQAAERFSALVHVAIAEFNRGGMVRAERVFDLAERMLATGPLDPALVEPLRASAHRQLDLERLRRLFTTGQRLPPGMLRFFRVFAPETLVDRFCREPRRERGELVLSLLEAHGPRSRAIARERLLGARGNEDDPSRIGRLVHLLRRLPRPPDDGRDIDEEVRAVARLLAPEGPPSLVNEALVYLGRAAHPGAERALVLFLRELEGMLLESVPCGDRGDRLTTVLDRTAVALARQGSSACRAALVAHGLRTEAALGDTAARLAPLGVLDLGATPDLAGRLIDAANACLPPGLLTPLPARQSPLVLRIVAALRATRMPEVRELFHFLALRFPLQVVGVEAARALESFDAQRTPPASHASLAGDLQVFGLPVLLQNLADGGVTGVLTLGEAARPPAATFVFEKGRLRSVRVGATVGPPAVYQLLQRPCAGRFTFLDRQGAGAWGGEPAQALAVHELILEGLRRCDELQLLARRVPDDAAFEATGRPPSVADAWDIDLVIRLWERATEGESPRSCEEALGVDAWQVRRCLAHWLEDASLHPRRGTARRGAGAVATR
jgi:hypothetical protein